MIGLYFSWIHIWPITSELSLELSGLMYFLLTTHLSGNVLLYRIIIEIQLLLFCFVLVCNFTNIYLHFRLISG